MRLLIVKLSSIGDVIHALPSLAAIRRAMPTAEISWIVEQRSAEILRNNPLIDDLIEVNTQNMRVSKIGEGALSEAGRQVSGLRGRSFDLAIDLQGLIKSGLIARLSKAKARFGFSKGSLRESAARVFYTDSVDVQGNVHVIEKNLALVSGALDIEVPSSGFEFPIATDSEHIAEAETIVNMAGSDNIAVLNPAGGWVTKLWPASNFGELADRLWDEHGLVSIVATGPREIALAEKAAAGSRSGKIVLAQPGLKGFYELMRRAKLYVGGDTGPTHIAVAAAAPVVGLFGPTEWWRNGSPNPEDVCVERNDIDCRVDCHRRTCSKWICMDSDVDAVYAAAAERLRRVAKPAKAVLSVS